MSLSALLDLAFPRTCVACGAGPLPPRREYLCVRCLGTIEPLPPSPCPVCAGDLGPAAAVSSCEGCFRLRPRFDAATAVGRYDGVLADLVVRLKYAGRATCAWPLGKLLAETVELWPEGRDAELVVPVPIHPLKRLRRGMNHAERIASEVARRLGLPVVRHALRVAGRRPPQAGRSRTERLSARRGAYVPVDPGLLAAPVLRRLPAGLASRLADRLEPRVRGRTVLLVDDVLTTVRTSVRPQLAERPKCQSLRRLRCSPLGGAGRGRGGGPVGERRYGRFPVVPALERALPSTP